MTRRNFSLTASGLALTGPLALAAPTGRSILELRWLHMRTNTENQMQRTTEFLRTIAPALKRSGATQLGFFGSVIADESPFILSLRSFPSLSALDAANEKMAADKEYIQARDAYNATPG